MKRHNVTTGIAVLTLALGLGACDDDLAGINENPNAPTDVSAEYILSQAQQSAVDLVFGRALNMNIGSTWAQHFAQIQYPDEDRFKLRPSDVDGVWESFYSNSLKDLQTTIEKSQEAGNANREAVARILRAWEFGIMTDLWGNIPYSEALSADKEDGTTTPAYDPQSEIYPDLLAELKAAAEMINNTDAGFGENDLLYGGDMEAWRKFANSLRLRLAMRLSEVDPTTAQQHFTEALAAGVFESNADNAVFNYIASPPNENPIFEDSYRNGRYDHAISETMVTTLSDLSDPRLAVYAQPRPADSTYAGAPNGSLAPVNTDEVSAIGAYWRTNPAAPMVLMSFAEVEFLKAEAAARGWILDDVQTLYESGIRASMEWYGIPDADITTYLGQAGVQFDADQQFEQIATQKWIALYANGIEAWTEWRRTGYPSLQAGPDALNDGLIPVRLPYPGAEQTYNEDNLTAAVSAQGLASSADMNAPVWWDK